MLFKKKTPQEDGIMKNTEKNPKSGIFADDSKENKSLESNK